MSTSPLFLALTCWVLASPVACMQKPQVPAAMATEAPTERAPASEPTTGSEVRTGRTTSNQPPVLHRAIMRINVVKASLLRTGSSEYSVDVVAEFSNSCFAPSPEDAPERLIFDAQTREDDSVEVNLFELPPDYDCPLEDNPVSRTYRIENVAGGSGTTPVVFINGIQAR